MDNKTSPGEIIAAFKKQLKAVNGQITIRFLVNHGEGAPTVYEEHFRVFSPADGLLIMQLYQDLCKQFPSQMQSLEVGY